MEPLPEPTKRELHGYTYSPLEKAEKEAAIKQMMRDYPDTPGGEFMCEWVYDFIMQTPPEELERRVASGEFDKPSKFSTEANKKLIEQYNNEHCDES